MEAKQTHTLQEAHEYFGKTLTGKVRELLERPDRTRTDNEMMVHASHASLYRWLQVGTGLHHQRGEWLIACVFTVIGVAGPALRHAERCLESTNEFASTTRDSDRA